MTDRGGDGSGGTSVAGGSGSGLGRALTATTGKAKNKGDGAKYWVILDDLFQEVSQCCLYVAYATWTQVRPFVSEGFDTSHFPPGHHNYRGFRQLGSLVTGTGAGAAFGYLASVASARWSQTPGDVRAGLEHAFGPNGSRQATRFEAYVQCRRAGRNAAFEFARAWHQTRVEAARVEAARAEAARVEGMRIESARMLAAAAAAATATAPAEALAEQGGDEEISASAATVDSMLAAAQGVARAGSVRRHDELEEAEGGSGSLRARVAALDDALAVQVARVATATRTAGDLALRLERLEAAALAARATGPVCRWFRSSSDCNRGPACPFQHV